MSGVSLALVDRNPESLDRMAAELSRSDIRCLPQAVDLAEFGGLDAVVSNAGCTTRASLVDLAVEDYERVFAVNTRAA